MIHTYTFKRNSRIETFITRIDSYKDLFEKLPSLPHIHQNILRTSTLKSSLYSARIEGNSLELSEAEMGMGRNQEKKEVFQIFQALQYVRTHSSLATKEFLFEIHNRTMDGLTSKLGRFRAEQSAIFNTAGIAIYLPPPPQKVSFLIDELLTYINNSLTDITKVAVVHFVFEKIHPFLDGNGRVGRILMNWQLQKMGYHFAGLLSFEEYLEKNRELYYHYLSIQEKDITEFVEFILEGIAESAQQVILELEAKKEEKIEDTLLPRRAEILDMFPNSRI